MVDPATPHPSSAAASADYTNFFIQNVILNRNDYRDETREVWEHMRQNPKISAGEAIEWYIHKAAIEFAQQNDGKEMRFDDRRDLRVSLSEQVLKLRQIEADINGIEPDAETIADTFINNRVLDGISEDGKAVWQAMKDGNLNAEDAINQYVRSHNGDAEMRTNLTREIAAVEGIREGIIEYEQVDVTKEKASALIRDTWKDSGMSDEKIEMYAADFESIVDRYQSAEGGRLDIDTAVARAAVDVRADIDRDNGVPERVITDSNHALYNNQTLMMGNWIRNEIYKDEHGGVSEEMAEQHGVDMDAATRANTTPLGLLSGLYGQANYTALRRDNLEQSMQVAYENGARPQPLEKMQTVHPVEEPEVADIPHVPTTRHWGDPALHLDVTETLAEQAADMFDLVGRDYTGAFMSLADLLPERLTAAFQSEAYDLYNTAYEIDAAANPAEKIQATHEFASFIKDGLEEAQMDIIKENWGIVERGLEGLGMTVGDEDFQLGVETMQNQPQALVHSILNNNGAGSTYNFQDVFHEFTLLDLRRRLFGEETTSLERVAGTNNITLEGVEPPAQDAAAPDVSGEPSGRDLVQPGR